MSKLDALIKDFNRRHKEVIISRGIPKIQTQKIPFSSPRLNYMLYGGLPRGRIVEFAGEENSGKTTTALDSVANAQRMFLQEWQDEINALQAIEKPKKEQIQRLEYLRNAGAKTIIYADCENTLDEEWAKKLGVDIESLIVLKPQSQTAEQIFEMLLQAIETGEVGMVVIDSLGVMISSQAYEKTMEEKTYGGIAAALTLFSKKAELLCAKTGCLLIGINQMREDMNSTYGGTITTGGKGWKHNCSVRLMFQKGSYIDDKGNELRRSAESPAGNLVMVNIAKTKICKPDRRVGYYTLKYDTGIDAIADLFDIAIRCGVIVQTGSWFNFVDLETGEVVDDADGEVIKLQGKASVLEYIKSNPPILDLIMQYVEPLIKN